MTKMVERNLDTNGEEKLEKNAWYNEKRRSIAKTASKKLLVLKSAKFEKAGKKKGKRGCKREKHQECGIKNVAGIQRTSPGPCNSLQLPVRDLPEVDDSFRAAKRRKRANASVNAVGLSLNSCKLSESEETTEEMKEKQPALSRKLEKKTRREVESALKNFANMCSLDNQRTADLTPAEIHGAFTNPSKEGNGQPNVQKTKNGRRKKPKCEMKKKKKCRTHYCRV